MPDFFSKLGRIAKTTEEGFFPNPVTGLFSNDEVRRSRGRGLMGFGTALLSGASAGEAISSAESSYQDAQSNLLAQKKAQRDQALLAARNAIGQKYAAKPGDTPASLALKYPAMMQDYLAAGDLEAAAKLEPMVTKILGDKPTKWQTVQLGDRVVFVNPETQETIDGPDRHMLPEEAELRRLALEERKMAMQLQHDEHERAMGMTAQNAFVRQNAKLIDTEQKWGNWQASYNEAQAGNPAAYKSAVINFVSMADPGTQIRLGMLQFASQLDPSIQGRMDLFLKKNAEGKLPPRILEWMNEHATELHANTVDIYRKRYEARVRANPMLQAYLDPPEVAFPMSYNLPAELAERRKNLSRQPAGNTSRVQPFLKGKKTEATPTPRGQQRFDWTTK